MGEEPALIVLAFGIRCDILADHFNHLLYSVDLCADFGFQLRELDQLLFCRVDDFLLQIVLLSANEVSLELLSLLDKAGEETLFLRLAFRHFDFKFKLYL